VQSLLPYITGSCGAIVILAVVCYFFFSGKLHSDAEFSKLEKENDDLKEALADERKAVDDAARTGTVTNQLIGALIKVATQKQGDHDRRTDRDQAGALPTPEDLGL
jgi:hypothetical protein